MARGTHGGAPHSLDDVDCCRTCDRLGLPYTIGYSGEVGESVDPTVLVDDEPIDQDPFEAFDPRGL